MGIRWHKGEKWKKGRGRRRRELKTVDWVRWGAVGTLEGGRRELRTHLSWGRASERKDGDTSQRGVSSCIELRRESWLQTQKESKSNK